MANKNSRIRHQRAKVPRPPKDELVNDVGTKDTLGRPRNRRVRSKSLAEGVKVPHVIAHRVAHTFDAEDLEYQVFNTKGERVSADRIGGWLVRVENKIDK